MNLLLVTQDFPPNTGGIETYSFELAKRFHEAADYFSVLAPAHNHAWRVDGALDYPVVRTPVANSLLPLAGFWTISREVRRHRIDTVFLSQWQTALAALIARKVTGYPRRIYVAAHARELLIDPFSGRSGWFSRKLYGLRKRIFSRVNGFFPVSRYTANVLRKDGVPEDKIHIVGNGTDPRHFRPRDTAELRREMGAEDKKVIFTICRLVPRKGIDLVLHALQRLKRERGDLLYLVGGTGADEGRLRALTDELDLNGEVRFLGRVDGKRLPEYYSLADVFVMPAREQPPDVEGFGIVFLEASACGVPVIGSRSGGIPDAIQEGETGLIVEEGSVDALTDALRTLLDDPGQARRMGERGRRHVQEHATWDRVSSQLLEVMREDEPSENHEGPLS